MTENWKTYNWGNLATLEYGKGLRDYRCSQGNYRVYGTNGAIGWHSEALCKHAGIVIGRKGAYRGVHYSNEPFYVIDTAFYLKPKQNIEIDLKWAYYELLTKDIDGMDSGSAIPSTTRESFYQLPVKVPPIEEQRRIAEILSTFDEKIQLNLEMNRTLERIAQATFRHWFLDFQFPDFDGELVDGLPKGWRMGKLGEIIEVKNGYAFKGTDFINAGVPVLKIKNVKPNKILLNNLSYVSEEVAKKAEKYIIKKNTLLVTMSGNRIDGTPDTWVGKVGLFNENKKYLLNQRVSALELKDKFAHFLYYLTLLLSSEDFQYYFISNATSSGGQANISPTFINNSEILIPAVDVVKAYSKMVESIYLKTQENVNQIQTLTQIRDSLLPKLMSGKIRVAE